MVAIEVAAAKATEEPNDGRASINDNVAANQTVRIGDLKRASTLWKKGCCCTISLLAFSCRGMTSYNSTISSKCEHHTTITSHTKKPTMPDTDYNMSVLTADFYQCKTY